MPRPQAATVLRFAALGGLAAGLAAAPALVPRDALPPLLIAAGLLTAVALRAWARRAPAGSGEALTTIAGVGAAALLLGAASGLWRLDAIDSAALDLDSGTRVNARGHVVEAARVSRGITRFRLATPDGAIAVEVRGPVAALAAGDAVRVAGEVRDPLPWESGRLRREGAGDVVSAARVERLQQQRGGLAGALDGLRRRVEDALGRGTPPASAALLRGFVLGQAGAIDPATVEAFRRSGLAHLLAVSGTNVMLLSLLAGAVLGQLGVPLRSRLLWTLVLIAIYVPIAGASPSIQRAGVMGAAGIVAVLASRPRSRAYALLLAAAATLAVNPRASGDVGWQLSFAAVTGILLWAGPVAELLRGPEAGGRAGIRAALASGAGLTVAATVATAPLLAHHFGALPLTSLPANLLALPAVAPVMWLGMAAGALGQVAAIPVEPVTALGGAFAAYIGQIAGWMAAPSWSLLDAELESPGAVALAYALLAVAMTVILRWARRRWALRSRGGALAAGMTVAAAAAAVMLPGAGQGLLANDGRAAAVPPGGLAVSVLDVGQGDAILLEPAAGAPILVDAGLPGGGAAAALAARGIERLGALVITHPDADHAGGGLEVLATVTVAELLQASPDTALARAARARGVGVGRLTAGDRLRSGPLRLDVLWPPRRLLDLDWEAEPNRLSLVLLVRFRGFRMLLSGDAEAEVTPIDPGKLDVLKLAHHGSEDAGLGELLARTRPRLGVISAGEDNPFGHPSPTTVATLAANEVPVLRTDRDGEIAITVRRRSWGATGER